MFSIEFSKHARITMASGLFQLELLLGGIWTRVGRSTASISSVLQRVEEEGLPVEEARAAIEQLQFMVLEPLTRVGSLCGVSNNVDVRAAEIIERSKSLKTLKIRYMKAELLNGPGSGATDELKVYPGGFCAHVEGRQRYALTPDPEGTVEVYTLRGAQYVKKGEGKHGQHLVLGGGYHYQDFNF